MAKKEIKIAREKRPRSFGERVVDALLTPADWLASTWERVQGPKVTDADPGGYVALARALEALAVRFKDEGFPKESEWLSQAAQDTLMPTEFVYRARDTLKACAAVGVSPETRAQIEALLEALP